MRTRKGFSFLTRKVPEGEGGEHGQDHRYLKGVLLLSSLSEERWRRFCEVGRVSGPAERGRCRKPSV